MIRAFLGIDLPKELKKDINTLGYIQVPTGIRLKWVEEPNFHITLKFFGSVSESTLKKIHKQVKGVGEEFSGFKLEVEEVGMFLGKDKAPRVVWLGLTPSEPLLKLHQALEKSFKKLNLNKKKENFHPHITLFRVKSVDSMRSFEKYYEDLRLKAEKIKGFAFFVKELVIFKSTLTPRGPVYEKLYQVELKHGE